MTADDAKKLTADANATDSAKATIVLKCWHHAIEKAATKGRRFVRDSEVDRPRTPIPDSARRAALEQLVVDGFTVQQFDENNRTVTEVSW